MLKPPRERTTEQKNCLELADFIEYGPWAFDMLEIYPHTECGTAGCILGHADVLWNDSYVTGTLLDKIKGTERQMAAMCLHPVDEQGNPIPLCNVTRHMAAAALRRFALYKQTYFEVEK